MRQTARTVKLRKRAVLPGAAAGLIVPGTDFVPEERNAR